MTSIPSRRLVSSVASAVTMLSAAMPAAAQQNDSGMRVTMTTSDRSGRPHRPEGAEPFRLALQVADARTGQPRVGLKLASWIRPVEQGNSSCQDAAQSLRATRGVPRGATDLNGELVAVLNDDSSFGVVDRRLDQSGANMTAAATFQSLPETISFDPARMRALAVMGAQGSIEEVDLLTGAQQVLSKGFSRPTDVRATRNGNVWIAESGRGDLARIDIDGRVTGRLAVSNVIGHGAQANSGQIAFRDTGVTDLIGVFSTDGGLALIDDLTSSIRWQSSGPAIEDARFVGESTAILLPSGEKAIDIRYTDDPGTPLRIPIGIDVTRLAVTENGRYAIAYTPGEPLFVIVDLAKGQLLEAGHMRENMAIQEAAFIGKNLYLLSEAGGYVAIIEIAALGRKDRPEPRLIGLAQGEAQGQARVQHPAKSGGDGVRIAALDQARALVVDRSGYIGLVLHDAMAIGNMPPDDYVRLRSGVPRSIGIIDRSLREIAPGRFETVARLETTGEHELILTTGVSGLTTCIRFTVDGEEADAEHVFTVSATPRDGSYKAGRTETVDFAFRSASGDEIAVPNARFLVSSLQSAWTLQVDANRGPDNRLQAQIRFPHPGLFSISPIDIPQAFILHEPVLTEVSP
ncbi:MAG: hypothetical protein QM636_15395 [Rhizobium sp.]